MTQNRPHNFNVNSPIMFTKKQNQLLLPLPKATIDMIDVNKTSARWHANQHKKMKNF